MAVGMVETLALLTTVGSWLLDDALLVGLAALADAAAIGVGASDTHEPTVNLFTWESKPHLRGDRSSREPRRRGENGTRS
jgi:hypothetical protein